MKDSAVIKMPITKLRKELMRLPELLNENEQITVTSHGQPIAAIVSFNYITKLREELEEMRQEIGSLQETIEILRDAELMEDIRKGMQALQNGDTVSLEEARLALGIE